MEYRSAVTRRNIPVFEHLITAGSDDYPVESWPEYRRVIFGLVTVTKYERCGHNTIATTPTS